MFKMWQVKWRLNSFDLISYLNGLSATALVMRAIVFPSSSLVSTGQIEDWVSNSTLTFNSSIWDGVSPSSLSSADQLGLFPFSLETRWRNCCLFFVFCSLHRSFGYPAWKEMSKNHSYREYSLRPNTTSVSLVLFRDRRVCKMKSLIEGWATVEKSLAVSTTIPSSSSVVFECDSTCE